MYFTKRVIAKYVFLQNKSDIVRILASFVYHDLTLFPFEFSTKSVREGRGGGGEEGRWGFSPLEI